MCSTATEAGAGAVPETATAVEAVPDVPADLPVPDVPAPDLPVPDLPVPDLPVPLPVPDVGLLDGLLATLGDLLGSLLGSLGQPLPLPLPGGMTNSPDVASTAGI